MSAPLQQISQADTGVARKVPGRPIHPIRSLRRHAAWAVLAFVLVNVLGFPIAWKKGNRTYAAQASIYISPRFLKNLDDDKEFELQSNSQYREFVQQHVKTVARYDIIQEAVNRLSTQGHPWQRLKETPEQAVTRLQGRLKVLPVPDTYQITVGLEDDQPKDLAETVNTVVDVFLEKSRDEDFYGRDERVASLQQEATTLNAEIDADIQEKDRLARELAVSVFTEGFSNPFDQLLVGSKQALAAARQRRISSEAQLASLGHRAAPGGPTGLQAYASEMAGKDADITTYESNSNFRRSELIAQLNGMLPTHPARQSIESEIQSIDDVYSTRRSGLEAQYASVLLAQRSAEASADAVAERKLQEQADSQAAQAKWYSHNYQRGINIRYAMDRARHRLEAIQDRMDFIELESHAPGFARMFSPARPPEESLTGGHRRPLILLALLAGALSVAIPIVLDRLDTRLFSPNDVEKVLGFPPIGYTVVPSAISAPKKRVERLAVAIEREFAARGSLSYLFVPVNEQTHISLVVADLARELNLSGRPARVIADVDEFALAPVTTSGLEIEDFAEPRARAVAPLRHMRSLVKEANLTAQAEDALILIEAPAFTASAETELWVSFCDVVVLAVQAARTTKKTLIEALHTLQNVKPKAIAVLVVGFDPHPPLPRIRLGLRHAYRMWLMLSKYWGLREETP